MVVPQERQERLVRRPVLEGTEQEAGINPDAQIILLSNDSILNI